MNRFVLLLVLTLAGAICSADRASAQYYQRWQYYGGYYTPYPGAMHVPLLYPPNPYGINASSNAVPTLINPQYVVGNNRVQVTPYNSPNIYAPRRYEYRPYPAR
jgi:hypothetical protein